MNRAPESRRGEAWKVRLAKAAEHRRGEGLLRCTLGRHHQALKGETPCGALVFAARLSEHLTEVHELRVTDELLDSFERVGPLDREVGQ